MTESQSPGEITTYTCPQTLEGWTFQRDEPQIAPNDGYDPRRPQPPEIFAERTLTAQDMLNDPPNCDPIIQRFGAYLVKQLHVDRDADPDERKDLMYAQQLFHACLTTLMALSTEPILEKRITSLQTDEPLPLATNTDLNEYLGNHLDL